MTTPINADTKIAIIGAGSAGLSTALFLKRNGYKNVTVLEKMGYVGGLCRTVTQDYENFDLGANYITPAFSEVLKLAREFGMEMYGERDGAAVEMPEDGGEPIWKNIWAAVKDGASNHAFLWDCFRYWILRIWIKPIIDKPGFKNVSKHKDLCVSFHEWLESKNLLALTKLFEAPISIMGYGYIVAPDPGDPFKSDKEVPAPHALKYMSPFTFFTLVVKLTPIFRRLPWPKRFVLGYQRLWEVISFKLNVEKNIKIEGITRENGNKITITFSRQQHINNDLNDSKPRKLTFDKLIIACPLQEKVINTLLDDMTQEEEHLFGHVITYSYKMTSCHVKDFDLKQPIVATIPLAPIGTPWAITRQYDHSDMIQFYSRVPNHINYSSKIMMRAQEEIDDRKKEPGFCEICEETGLPYNLTILPSVSPIQSEHTSCEDIDPKVIEFVNRIGGKIDCNAWRTFDQWPYFQHFRAREIKEGFYDKLEDMQGKNSTYYVGGLMNFELVEMIVRYTKHLVNENFPPVK